MIDQHRVLGLITARGGSKGLPGKNIKPLCGRPLIDWTIAPALKSKHLDAVVVSTDSEEIAAVARASGASVPFLRPESLASDQATSIDVVEHAVKFLEAQGSRFDLLVLLEPTSPLRDTADIDSGVRQLVEAGADSLVSVCAAESMHPAFMFRKNDAGRLESSQEGGFRALRRQDLEPRFFLDGTLYVSRIDPLLKQRTFCQTNTVGYEVPKWKSPEVDDIVDFMLVEAIIKHRGLDKGATP